MAAKVIEICKKIISFLFLKLPGSICFSLFAWNVSAHWGNRTRSSEKLLEILKWFITESQQPSRNIWEPGWHPKTAGVAGSHLRCFPWFNVFPRKSKQERMKPVCSWLQLQNRNKSKLLTLNKEESGSVVYVYGKSQIGTFWARRQHSFTSPAISSVNETLPKQQDFFHIVNTWVFFYKLPCVIEDNVIFFHRNDSIMITICQLVFKFGLPCLESKWKVIKTNLSILWKLGLSISAGGSFKILNVAVRLYKKPFIFKT